MPPEQLQRIADRLGAEVVATVEVLPGATGAAKLVEDVAKLKASEPVVVEGNPAEAKPSPRE